MDHSQKPTLHRYLPVLLGLMLFSTANAAYSFGFYRNPKHPGKCYINESMILSPGDVRYFKSCSKLECHSEKGDATMISCVVFAAPRGCTYYYPKAHENYPNCCEIKVVCPDDLKESHAKMDHKKVSSENETTTKTANSQNAVDYDRNDKNGSVVSSVEIKMYTTTETAKTENSVDLTTTPTTEKDIDLVSTTLTS